MDKIKNFLSNHFEKIALIAAVLIAIAFLIGAFRGGEVDKLGADIEDLIQTIEFNMKAGEIEEKYNPDKIPPYDDQALDPFRNVPEGKRLAGVRWYPRVILELEPIILELPPRVPFEKTFETYSPEWEEIPEATVVRIENEDLATVELVDTKNFLIRRAADLEESGSTLIHIYYEDKRHAVRRLEVAIRIVYVPRPPQETDGYARPGRNFIIWRTHPDDVGNVVGFDIFRKEAEEEEFDLANRLNRDLILPLSYIPMVGEDEEGEVEGEGEEPGLPGEEPAEKPEGEERPPQRSPFALPGGERGPGPGREGKSPFVLGGPGERGRKSSFSLSSQNVGGRFIDRDVTPLHVYWYAVQTVAKKPAEERAKRESLEEEDMYVRSALSEPVFVRGSDVIKIIFRSLLGRVDDPELKKQARAVIEIRRFVKVAWVVGTFNLKIGDRIGGKTWVKDYPEIDPETGELRYVGTMVDFATKYTLQDIVAIIKNESYKVKVYKPDPKTGRMIEHEVTMYREVKRYKIIVKHDEGLVEEYPLERPERRKPKIRTREEERRREKERRRPGGRLEEETRRMEEKRRRGEEERRRMMELIEKQRRLRPR